MSSMCMPPTTARALDPRCWTQSSIRGIGGAVGGRPEPSRAGVLPQARLRCRWGNQVERGVREIRMVRGGWQTG